MSQNTTDASPELTRWAVGRVLDHFRYQTGESQSSMAKKLGVSQRTMAGMCYGETPIWDHYLNWSALMGKNFLGVYRLATLITASVMQENAQEDTEARETIARELLDLQGPI